MTDEERVEGKLTEDGLIIERPRDTPQTQAIDVGDLIAELCSRFMLEPRHVRRIDIYPHEARVEAYELNEDGRKHTRLNDETGELEPAVAEHVFAIITA